MNCEEMMKMPQLNGVLQLKAGAAGSGRSIRWIYFADTLDCIKSEYRVENYVHGGEFVVLTNRSVTGDDKKLLSIITEMYKLNIAAIGINEGQISDALMEYCEEHQLPLFELPERFPLVDLSQLLCQRLVLEENARNSAEQLLSSIIDAEHLNRENVYAQARFLNIDLSGYFCVVEFAFSLKTRNEEAEEGAGDTAGMGDSLSLGQAVRRIIHSEFSSRLSQNILTQLQTGSVLALIPAGKMSRDAFRQILKRIVERVRAEYHAEVVVGVGENVGYLDEVRRSRSEAAAAIQIGAASHTREPIIFYKDQGLYTLISHINDSKFLDEFVEKNIGKLIYADEVHEGNLCETLETYLNYNCSVKNTAEALYIHRNTMNYRLNKIWEILGYDCSELDRCIVLKLAFMIRNLHNRR